VLLVTVVHRLELGEVVFGFKKARTQVLTKKHKLVHNMLIRLQIVLKRRAQAQIKNRNAGALGARSAIKRKRLV